MAITDNTLPTLNLTFSDMAEIYGVGRSADLGTMYRTGNINMFSLRKPQSCRGLFVANPTGIDEDHSLVCPEWDVVRQTNPTAWTYRRPAGGESSPYRGGDSAGYYRLAKSFVNSGQTGVITHAWSIRNQILTLTFTRPPHPSTINLLESNVKQHGAYLKDWYWGVCLRGPGIDGGRYWYLAGNIQLDGITSYSTLGVSGGNSITVPLTAQMIDQLNGGTATFFLFDPTSTDFIPGMTNAQIQTIVESGTKIGIFAGVDPGSGNNWINPVPLSLTRSGGNVTSGGTYLAYDARSGNLDGYAAEAVKATILDGSGLLWLFDESKVYPIATTSRDFRIDFQCGENPNTWPRTDKIGIYLAKYPSYQAAPALDRCEVSITQAQAPISFTVTPHPVVVNTGNSQAFLLDMPSGTKWWVRGTGTTADVWPSGHNCTWITGLRKIESNGYTTTSIPLDGSCPDIIGSTRLLVECEWLDLMDAERTGYIYLSPSEAKGAVIKIIQKPAM